MRGLYFFIFFVFFSLSVTAGDLSLKVIEKKGKVDLKFRGSEEKTINLNDIVRPGSEIFTGLRGSLSLEFGEGSYVTINQLTKVTIESVRFNNKDASVDVILQNGFVVILAKKSPNLNPKISVLFSQGSVAFQNSGGEVYLRKEQGAIIKSFLGKVTVNPKIKTFYFIVKDEICGITPDGALLEYDYFLKQDINTKPNEITNANQIEAYFEYLSKPYNFETGSNDYRDNLRP